VWVYAVWVVGLGAGAGVTLGLARLIVGLVAVRKCETSDLPPVLRALFGKPDPPKRDEQSEQPKHHELSS
jgi:hypothetical protein